MVRQSILLRACCLLLVFFRLVYLFAIFLCALNLLGLMLDAHVVFTEICGNRIRLHYAIQFNLHLKLFALNRLPIALHIQRIET